MIREQFSTETVFFVEYSTINMSDQFPILYQNRYCDQEDFNIAVFGGENDSENEMYDKPFLLNNFETKVYLPSVLMQNNGCKSIASGSDIYLLKKFEGSYFSSFMMYSSSTNNWKNLPSGKTPRTKCSICTFMQKLFVICGKDYWGRYDRSCMFYDKQSENWSSFAAMMEERERAACTVFEGKIVVSGGLTEVHVGFGDLHAIILNSVEVYEYHENKWSYFPSMLNPNYDHTAVSISNKIYMVGGCSYICEVFDSVTRMFTSISILPKWIRYLEPNQTVCIGYNVYFFPKGESKEIRVHSYDFKNSLFSYITSLKMKNTESFSCTKVGMY